MIIQGQYHLKSKKWGLNKTFQVNSNASKEMLNEYKEIIFDQIYQLIVNYLLNKFDVEEYEEIRGDVLPTKISQIQFKKIN